MGHRFPQHQHALTASGMVLCEDVGPFQSSKTKAAKRPFLLARTEARRHTLRKFCEQFLNLYFTSRAILRNTARPTGGLAEAVRSCSWNLLARLYRGGDHS